LFDHYRERVENMATNEYHFEHKLDELREQLQRVSGIPFYEEHFADVDPAGVASIEAFRELPFMTTGDLVEEYDARPPHGSFFSEDVRQVNMTPAGEQLLPEFNTERDLDRLAESFADQFRSQGIGEGDVFLNCTTYTVFLGGLASHIGLQAAGAAVVPVGGGDSEQAAHLARRLDADGMLAFPSFGLKIAEQADVDLDVFVGGGEPFTSVPGLREEVREAFGGDTTVVDTYALSEIIPVAAECEHENGLHVADDYVLVEIIDPETDEPVAPGERGEVVLTHLQKEAMPLIRYRTGDLTRLVDEECACGRSLTLPNGVFGRVDSRLKIKGVKFYPDAVGPVLTEFPGLTGEFLVEASRPNETDHLKINVEVGEGGTVDGEAVREALETDLLVGIDDVELVETLDTEGNVHDKRY
jgi:phenylacetate-CoA ligase